MVQFGLANEEAYSTVAFYQDIRIRLITDSDMLVTEPFTFMVTCGVYSYQSYMFLLT